MKQERITTKEQYRNAYIKRKYKRFWKTRWRVMTVTMWTNFIHNENERLPAYDEKYRPFRDKYDLVCEGLTKLRLEKRITMEQVDSIIKMLNSPDQESIYLAMSAMQVIRPRMFRKQKQS